jgi:hypothetical protein
VLEEEREGQRSNKEIKCGENAKNGMGKEETGQRNEKERKGKK